MADQKKNYIRDAGGTETKDQIINSNRKKYELDELALKMGHEVIRLPPYHCQYNPIELIWAQVKNQVATKNTTFKMVDIEQLTHQALDSVTQRNWEKCVKHIESVQDKDYDKDILRDSLLEPIILTYCQTTAIGALAIMTKSVLNDNSFV